MSKHIASLIVLAATLAAMPALGGVPNEIHHQGVIAVHGERFDGQGDFYFALVDELGYNLWTNDGTKIDPPSQDRPDSPVTLTVVNGVYRVRLGNTADGPTMTPIPRAVFNENDHVALRIWFTDGVNGIHQLSPDQLLTGVPYAQRLPNVFVDESTGNVGIGTTMPTEQLHVNGNIRLLDDADIYGLDMLVGDNDLRFYGDSMGGPDVYISSGGDVGIGTTSPRREFHVKGDAGVLALEGDTHVYLEWWPHGVAGGRKAYMGWGDSDNPVDLTIHNEVAGGNILLRPTGGKVGIGTTEPASHLHVAGGSAQLRLQNDPGDDGSYTSVADTAAGYSGVAKHASSGGVMLDLDAVPADGENDAAIRIFRGTATTGKRRLLLYRGDGSAALDAQVGVGGENSFFQIGGGNVGIGTEAPANELSVAGSADFSGDVEVSGNVDVGGHLTLTEQDVALRRGEVSYSGYPQVVGVGNSVPLAGIQFGYSFSAPPQVFVSLDSGNSYACWFHASVRNVTVDSFSFYVTNLGNAEAPVAGVRGHWLAVGN